MMIDARNPRKLMVICVIRAAGGRGGGGGMYDKNMQRKRKIKDNSKGFLLYSCI